MQENKSKNNESRDRNDAVKSAGNRPPKMFSRISSLTETTAFLDHEMVKPFGKQPDIIQRKALTPEDFGLDLTADAIAFAQAQSLLIKTSVDKNGEAHLDSFQYAVNGDVNEFNKKFEHIQGRNIFSDVDGNKDLSIKDAENYNNNSFVGLKLDYSSVQVKEGIFGLKYVKAPIEKPSLYLNMSDTYLQTDMSRVKGKSFLIGSSLGPSEISPNTAELFSYYDRSSIHDYAKMMGERGMQVETLRYQFSNLSAYEQGEIVRNLLRSTHIHDTNIFKNPEGTNVDDCGYIRDNCSLTQEQFRDLCDEAFKSYLDIKAKIASQGYNQTLPDYTNPMDVKRYITNITQQVLENQNYQDTMRDKINDFNLEAEKTRQTELEDKSRELAFSKDPMSHVMKVDCDIRLEECKAKQEYLSAIKEFQSLELSPIIDKNNDKEQIYDKNEILRSLGFSAPEKISTLSRADLVNEIEHMKTTLITVQPSIENKEAQNNGLRNNTESQDSQRLYIDSLNKTEDITKTIDILTRMVENHPDNIHLDRKNLYEYGSHDRLNVSQNTIDAIEHLKIGETVPAIKNITPEILESKEECEQAKLELQKQIDRDLQFIYHVGNNGIEQRNFEKIASNIDLDKVFSVQKEYIDVLTMATLLEVPIENFDIEDGLKQKFDKLDPEFKNNAREYIERQINDATASIDPNEVDHFKKELAENIRMNDTRATKEIEGNALAYSITAKDIAEASHKLLADSSKEDQITMTSVLRSKVALEILDTQIHSRDYSFDSELYTKFTDEMNRSEIMKYVGTHNEELRNLIAESQRNGMSQDEILLSIEKQISLNANIPESEMIRIRTPEDDFLKSPIVQETIMYGVPENTTYKSIKEICGIQNAEKALQDPERCKEIIKRLDSEISEMEKIKAVGNNGLSTFNEYGQLSTYKYVRDMVTEHIVSNNLSQLENSQITYEYDKDKAFYVLYTNEEFAKINENKSVLSEEFLSNMHDSKYLVAEINSLQEKQLSKEERNELDSLIQHNKNDLEELLHTQEVYKQNGKELSEFETAKLENLRKEIETLETKVDEANKVESILPILLEKEKESEIKMTPEIEARQQELLQKISEKEDLILYIRDNIEDSTIEKTIKQYRKEFPDSEIAKDKEFIESLERAGINSIDEYTSIQRMGVSLEEATTNSIKMSYLISEYERVNGDITQTMQDDLRKYILMADPQFENKVFQSNMIEAYTSNPGVDIKTFKEFQETELLRVQDEELKDLTIRDKKGNIEWNTDISTVPEITPVGIKQLQEIRESQKEEFQEKMASIVGNNSIEKIEENLSALKAYDFTDVSVQDMIRTKASTDEIIYKLDQHLENMHYTRLSEETKVIYDLRTDIDKVQRNIEEIQVLQTQKDELSQNSFEGASIVERFRNLRDNHLINCETQEREIDSKISRLNSEITSIAEKNGIENDSYEGTLKTLQSILVRESDFESKLQEINSKYSNSIESTLDKDISEENARTLISLKEKSISTWSESDKENYLSIVYPRETERPIIIRLAEEELEHDFNRARAIDEYKLCTELKDKLVSLQEERAAISLTPYEVHETNYRVVGENVSFDAIDNDLLSKRNMALEAESNYHKLDELRFDVEKTLSSSANNGDFENTLKSSVLVKNAYEEYVSAVNEYNAALANSSEQSRTSQLLMTECAAREKVSNSVFDANASVEVEKLQEMKIESSSEIINDFIKTHENSPEYRTLIENEEIQRHGDAKVENTAGITIEPETHVVRDNDAELTKEKEKEKEEVEEKEESHVRAGSTYETAAEIE